MRRRVIGGIAAAVVVGEITLGVAAHEAAPNAIAFSIALLAVVCGAVMVAARLRRPHGAIERCVYGVAVGLALLALGGIALHTTPWGLPRRDPTTAPAAFATPVLHGDSATIWWVALAIVALGAAGVRVVGHLVALPRAVRSGALWALAAMALTAAWTVAVDGAIQDQTPGFTQLSALRGGAASPRTVTVAIQSAERATTTYTLELVVDGVVDNRWADIRLAPGTRWETAVDFRSESEGPGIVEARLYRDDAPGTIYRRAISRP